MGAQPRRPVGLITTSFEGAPRRWATRDLPLDVFYEGRVTSVSEPTSQLTDTVFRELDKPRLVVRIRDTLGTFRRNHLAFEGAPLSYEHYDQRTTERVLRFTGTVIRPTIPGPDVVELECEDLQRDKLNQEIAAVPITTARFPTALARDVGQTAPVGYGWFLNGPLHIVHDDISGNTSDGLLPIIAGGGTPTVTKVRRDDVGGQPFGTVAASEYTVTTRVDALGTTWWVVRFNRRQLRHNSTEMHTLYVDVTSTDRNPANHVYATLTNPLWGLGLPANAGTFAEAAAVFSALGYKSDGMLWRPTRARDVLARLQLRGMYLDLNSAGEWIVTVDTPPTGTPFVLRRGPGVGAKNLLDCVGRGPARDRIRDLILEYELQEPFSDVAMFSVVRPVSVTNAFGTRLGTDEKIRPMIRDPLTAAMECDYLAKTQYYAGRDSAEIEVLPETKWLKVGDLVDLTDARMSYDRAIRRTWGFTDPMTRRRAVVKGYDALAFTYEPRADDIPASPAAGSAIDYTRTPPDAATNMSIAWTVRMAADGTALAVPTIQVDVATGDNFDHWLVKWRKNGTTPWSVSGKQTSQGVDVEAVIESGLVPGTAYDFIVPVFNKFGLASVGDPSLTNQLAPGDTTAPSIPTFALDGSQLRTVSARVTSVPPSDHGWYEYEVRTASSSSNGSGAGSVVKSARFDGTLALAVADLAYATAYHLRIRNKDASGNPATADGAGANWTATQSFTFTEAGNVDLGTGSVGTTTIATGAVTANSPYIDDTPTGIGTTETVVDQIDVAGVVANSRVDLQVFYLVAPGANLATVRLRKGTTVGGTLLDSFNHGALELGVLMSSDASPGAGTQSYVVTLQASAGTVTISRVRATRLLAKR